jgi:flagellar motor switch protein FliN/FliY
VPKDAGSQDWLLEEFIARLASAFEMMAGERPAIECQNAIDSPAGGLIWRQPFGGAPGAVWLSAAESDFTAIGGYLLLSAGLGDTDPESIKSTYLETLSQALSGLAQTISEKLNCEVTVLHGKEKDGAEQDRAEAGAASIRWSRAEIKLPRHVAVIHVGFEKALLDTLTAHEWRESAVEPRPPVDLLATSGAVTSRTFDLLLDVELPVSVSFGRAQVQLKDVLKLTRDPSSS